jgi:hypothetical protein
LNKAETRAHILEGLLKALDVMDEVIAIIRASKTVEDARQGLIERFQFTEAQAAAIVEMRLRQLTGLEREKLQNEYDELMKLINHLKEVLASIELQMGIIKDELVALFQKVSGNNELKVEFATLKDASVPALITLSEESRRMDEMLKLYAMNGMNMGMGSYPQQITLTLNLSSPLIAKLEAMEGQKQEVTAAYLYGLAQLSQKKLSAEELQKFLADSYTVLELL